MRRSARREDKLAEARRHLLAAQTLTGQGLVGEGSRKRASRVFRDIARAEKSVADYLALLRSVSPEVAP